MHLRRYRLVKSMDNLKKYLRRGIHGADPAELKGFADVRITKKKKKAVQRERRFRVVEHDEGHQT